MSFEEPKIYRRRYENGDQLWYIHPDPEQTGCFVTVLDFDPYTGAYTVQTSFDAGEWELEP